MSSKTGKSSGKKSSKPQGEGVTLKALVEEICSDTNIGMSLILADSRSTHLLLQLFVHLALVR